MPTAIATSSLVRVASFAYLSCFSCHLVGLAALTEGPACRTWGVGAAQQTTPMWLPFACDAERPFALCTLQAAVQIAVAHTLLPRFVKGQLERQRAVKQRPSGG